jgi:hypothetical protein
MSNSKITEEMFNQILEEIDGKLKGQLEWMSKSDDIDKCEEENRLAKCVLKELKEFYQNTNDVLFKIIATKSLSVTGGLPNLADLFVLFPEGDSPLEQKYYSKIAEFNKQFIIDNVTSIPTHILIKYLAFAIGNSSIGKEFIDAMKLDPNSPPKYKEEFNPETYDRRWYDKVYAKEPESILEQLEKANRCAYNNEYNMAIHCYMKILNTSNGEFYNNVAIYYMLCKLIESESDVLLAQMNINNLILAQPAFETSKECAFLRALINALTHYDTEVYTSAIRDYDAQFPLEQTLVTLLLRVKSAFL